jgi:hypothetical protein
VNPFHLEVDTLTDPPNYASVASDIDTWLTTLYKAVCTTSTTVVDLTVTEEDYPGATPGQAIHSINGAGTRTAADSFEPYGLTQVVTLQTATPKRYARGRMFMPPPLGSAALTSNGIWLNTNAYWTATTAFMNALLAGHTAGSTSYAPIVFSRTRAVTGASPYQFPITGYQQRLAPHWLRSRMTSP